MVDTTSVTFKQRSIRSVLKECSLVAYARNQSKIVNSGSEVFDFDRLCFHEFFKP